jgi:Domain of unknown function (DUF3854)
MISPEHLKMLADSGITADYAERRGYETITEPNSKRLADIGIVKAARYCVPGLLIPLLSADGTVCTHQYRPDNPRIKDNGKPGPKYETPYKRPIHLHVPPGVGELLRDPNEPLWVTEGIKKADCGALRGLCIVGLIGTYGWRGTNEHGGKTALADWNEIALNSGRQVVIGYDSDIARNDNVRQAAHALADYLAFKGSNVSLLWLPDTDEKKTGLDDYLANHTVEELWQLVEPVHPAKSADEAAAPAEPKPEPAQPVSLTKLHERFL